MRFFLTKLCINLANSTFNLYILYIKLAQNTKQFRSLVLEIFITAINFVYGKKGISWAYALGFGTANHLPPSLCKHATSIQCVKYVKHKEAKAFAGTGGMIF